DRQLRGKVQMERLDATVSSRLAALRAMKGIMRGFGATKMLTVYRGLVRSAIDYPAVAFQHLAGGARRRLEAWGDQGLRTCLGVRCGTGTWAVRAEAGEPALLLRWNGIVLRYDLMRRRRGEGARIGGGGGRRQHAKRFQTSTERVRVGKE